MASPIPTLALLILGAFPSAAALALPPLVQDTVAWADETVTSTVHAVDDVATSAVHETLAPIEPQTAAAPTAAVSPAAAAPPAASARIAAADAPWAAAFGAAFLGLLLAALRGPFERMSPGRGATFLRVMLGLALFATALALAFVAWTSGRADALWIAVLATAYGALVVGALAVRRAGRGWIVAGRKGAHVVAVS